MPLLMVKISINHVKSITNLIKEDIQNRFENFEGIRYYIFNSDMTVIQKNYF